MPQGTRGVWGRAASMGLGALLCAGAVGCMGTDKDRMPPPRIGANNTGKSVTPGLPGTPMLPGSSGVSATKSTQPGTTGGNPYAGYGSGGIQQTGGFATGAGTGATPGGRTVVQPSGPTGAGAGSGYVIPPVAPGAAPPTAGFGGMPAPAMDYPNGQGRGGSFNPPAPGLSDIGPIPPSPPGQVASGSNYSPIAPPQAPPAPNSRAVAAGGPFGAQ